MKFIEYPQDAKTKATAKAQEREFRLPSLAPTSFMHTTPWWYHQPHKGQVMVNHITYIPIGMQLHHSTNFSHVWPEKGSLHTQNYPVSHMEGSFSKAQLCTKIVECFHFEFLEFLSFQSTIKAYQPKTYANIFFKNSFYSACITPNHVS